MSILTCISYDRPGNVCLAALAAYNLGQPCIESPLRGEKMVSPSMQLNAHVIQCIFCLLMSSQKSAGISSAQFVLFVNRKYYCVVDFPVRSLEFGIIRKSSVQDVIINMTYYSILLRVNVVLLKVRSSFARFVNWETKRGSKEARPCQRSRICGEWT